MRALGAIRRADVCVMIIDSSEGITEQDVKILGYIHEQGKPSIVAMNKWDLIDKDTNTINKYNVQLSEALKFMDYFVPVYISAKTGQRADKILTLADKVLENANRRITTGQLNDLIFDCVRANEPPSVNGKRLKINYVTQVSTNPPSFVLFVNDSALMHFSYRRYLENCIRKAFDFTGTPIRISVRDKEEDD